MRVGWAVAENGSAIGNLLVVKWKAEIAGQDVGRLGALRLRWMLTGSCARTCVVVQHDRAAFDFGMGRGEDAGHGVGEIGHRVGLIAFGGGFGALFERPSGHAQRGVHVAGLLVGEVTHADRTRDVGGGDLDCFRRFEGREKRNRRFDRMRSGVMKTFVVVAKVVVAESG